VYSIPQPTVISSSSPASSGVFVDPAGGLTFTVSSTVTTIPTNGVQVIVNGIDVSSQLQFTGSPMNWNISFSGLLPNQFYSVTINVTDAGGFFTTASVTNFDTFSQSNLIWEAEDFDFGGGRFIDNPVPTAIPATNSYFLEATRAVSGVDLTTSVTDSEAYRYDACGTQVTSDVLRQKYVNAGVADYNIGWWYTGAWLNYTRTIPTNNYYIYGRLASGNGAYNVTNRLVVGGAGTATQTTKLLGTFSTTGTGWQSWQWVPLINTNGQLAVIPLGGVETFKMTSAGSVNANFYMLVPAPAAPKIAIVSSNSNPVLSFQTESGFSYLVVYKDELGDAFWKLLTIVLGDGTDKIILDPVFKTQRFYKVESL
jgi:hypothetical protein